MERTLDSYGVNELKDYIRGFYAIPLSDFTREYRTHLQAATKLLRDKGYDVQLRKGHKVVFPRVKEKVVPFAADELERVERTLDTYSADELKDYLRGLYAIPLREIDGNDRDQMRECKRLLKAMGWEFVFKGGSNIAFRKIRTEWKKWK